MKEIVVVTPFGSMSEVPWRVVDEYGYANVDLLEAEPSRILERRRLAIDGGAKAIIPRGGFYELIKTEFDIPTVDGEVRQVAVSVPLLKSVRVDHLRCHHG